MNKLSIIFDIDGVLVISDIEIDDPIFQYTLKNSNVLYPLGVPHPILPGVVEMFRYLISQPQIEIGFFSSGDAVRNHELVRMLFETILGERCFEKLGYVPRIGSRTELRDVKEHEGGIGWYSGAKKKDLALITRGDMNPARAILVDDSRSNVLPSQIKNHLPTIESNLMNLYDLIKPSYKHECFSPQNKAYQAINNIYYITGVLSACVAPHNEQPLSTILQVEDNMGQPYRQEHWYEKGLNCLKQFNPHLKLINQSILSDAQSLEEPLCPPSALHQGQYAATSASHEVQTEPMAPEDISMLPSLVRSLNVKKIDNLIVSLEQSGQWPAIKEKAYLTYALQEAVNIGSIYLTRYFLNKGIKDDLSLLLDTAIHQHDLSIVSLLVNYGANTDRGLGIAVDKNLSEIAQFLLNNGASLPKNECFIEVPLIVLAALHKDEVLIQALLRQGAKVKDSILWVADSYRNNHALFNGSTENARERYEQIMRVLFDYALGINFADQETLRSIVGEFQDIALLNCIGVSVGGIPVTKSFLQNLSLPGWEWARVTLSETAHHEQLRARIIEKALKSGESIDNEETILNFVSLSVAASMGDMNILSHRLNAGCDPNEVEDESDNQSTAPILLAAQNGHNEAVMLLATHPRMNKTQIERAFQIAKESENMALIHSLKGLIDINFKDKNGNSQLHDAAERLDIEEVKALLAQGANPNLYNNEEMLPVMKAICSCQAKDNPLYHELITLLLKKTKLTTSDADKALSFALYDLSESRAPDFILANLLYPQAITLLDTSWFLKYLSEIIRHFQNPSIAQEVIQWLSNRSSRWDVRSLNEGQRGALWTDLVRKIPEQLENNPIFENILLLSQCLLKYRFYYIGMEKSLLQIVIEETSKSHGDKVIIPMLDLFIKCSELRDYTILGTQDNEGNTALHTAALHGNIRAIELISKYSGNDYRINLQNKEGETALHLAVRHMINSPCPSDAMITLLLELGAQSATVNRLKQTPQALFHLLAKETWGADKQDLFDKIDRQLTPPVVERKSFVWLHKRSDSTQSTKPGENTAREASCFFNEGKKRRTTSFTDIVGDKTNEIDSSNNLEETSAACSSSR